MVALLRKLPGSSKIFLHNLKHFLVELSQHLGNTTLGSIGYWHCFCVYFNQLTVCQNIMSYEDGVVPFEIRSHPVFECIGVNMLDCYQTLLLLNKFT